MTGPGAQAQHRTAANDDHRAAGHPGPAYGDRAAAQIGQARAYQSGSVEPGELGPHQ